MKYGKHGEIILKYNENTWLNMAKNNIKNIYIEIEWETTDKSKNGTEEIEIPVQYYNIPEPLLPHLWLIKAIPKIPFLHADSRHQTSLLP